MFEVNQNRIFVAFFLRVLVGIIFLMQGWGKVMVFGFEKLSGMLAAYKETFLPDFVVDLTMYYTTFAELIGGFLLVVGLFRHYAAYALGAVLLIVAFGHGLVKPIWGLEDVVFRAVLLASYLVLPQDWDQWQADRLFRKK